MGEAETSHPPSILAASSRYADSVLANDNVSSRYPTRQRSVLMEDDQTVTFADFTTSRRDHSRDSSTRESLGRPSDQHRSSRTATFDFTLGPPPPGGRLLSAAVSMTCNAQIIVTTIGLISASTHGTIWATIPATDKSMTSVAMRCCGCFQELKFLFLMVTR